MSDIDGSLTEMFRQVVESDDCESSRNDLRRFLDENNLGVESLRLMAIREPENEDDNPPADPEEQKFLIDWLKNELEQQIGRPVILPDATELERFKIFLHLCTKKFGLGKGWKKAFTERLGIPLEEIRRYERGETHIPDEVFDELAKLTDFEMGEDDGQHISDEVAQAIINHQLTREEIAELVQVARKSVRHRASPRDLDVADALIDHYHCTIPDTGLLLGLTEGQIRSSYHTKRRKPRIISQEVARDDRPMDRDELLHIGIKLNNRKGSMQGAKRALSDFLKVPPTTINAWDNRREPIPSEIAKRLRDWYHSTS